MEYSMDLRSYLFINKTTQKDFAKIVGLSISQINNLVHKRNTATLFNALLIEYASGKQVTLRELLSKDEAAEFDKALQLHLAH